jgi:hypothetical protein
MTWKPIATAPRDGTFVLLKGGDTDEDNADTAENKRPIVARWWETGAGWGSGWAYAHWDSDWRSFYENPTHWMEIPV